MSENTAPEAGRDGASSTPSFSQLALAENILRALKQEGYERPTPIQTLAIPPLLEGKDLLGLAQTGTGKTAAFSLPLLHRLQTHPHQTAPSAPRALVLAPTRELALQIFESLRSYSRFMRVKTACVFGGVSIVTQIRTLARGVDILVATPGRLLDLLNRRNLHLHSVEYVVLDEADHMLDLGFIVPIRRIVSFLPKQRQNLFFSATMPKAIAGLADELLKDPVRVEAAPAATTAERVTQSVFLIERAHKYRLLTDLAAGPEVKRGLIFTRTKHGADRVARHLEGAGFASGAIHGDKSQNHRQRALDHFKSGKLRFLVATDIAARGVDVDGVSHVINFDMPDTPETYVHRIGRTARAGADGVAISLCDDEERKLMRAIEKTTRQTLPFEDRRDPQTIKAALANEGVARNKPRRPQRQSGRPPQDKARMDNARGGEPRAQRRQGPKPAENRRSGARSH